MASSKSKTATARMRAGLPVLITEFVEDFVALRRALEDEIGPNGVIGRDGLTTWPLSSGRSYAA